MEIETTGKCVTRNGESAISMVRVNVEGNMAKLGFVSSRLKRELHAGAVIQVRAMDDLAVEWVRARGLYGKAVNCGLDHEATAMGLDDIIVDLRGIQQKLRRS